MLDEVKKGTKRPPSHQKPGTGTTAFPMNYRLAKTFLWKMNK
jgi:hypothetical protein